MRVVQFYPQKKYEHFQIFFIKIVIDIFESFLIRYNYNSICFSYTISHSIIFFCVQLGVKQKEFIIYIN